CAAEQGSGAALLQRLKPGGDRRGTARLSRHSAARLESRPRLALPRTESEGIALTLIDDQINLGPGKWMYASCPDCRPHLGIHQVDWLALAVGRNLIEDV